MLKGVDVSSHNGNVDFDALLNAGVDFVIIRGGWGERTPSQDDTQCARNVHECVKRNIPYMLYLYSYATTLNDVDNEVAHAVELAKLYSPMCIYLDMEDADGYKMKHSFNVYENNLANDICVKWLQLMNINRIKCGIYANKEYFTKVLNYNQLKALGSIWIAQWGVDSPFTGCDVWQFTDKLNIAGKLFDGNYWYNDINNDPVYMYYPKYDVTLNNALANLGVDNSYNHRLLIANANGIVDYKGTKEQNMKLLDLLMAGKLIKA